ncbi:unnamed protein product [Aphis gossypii]|uniref:Uncharacterized protein n=1 Tax=Aphis gossypii TaxID=80765 RepID=A0A9P0NBV8_APHGO|nr:unnamed protein product [Aphis gossypii]
MAQIRVSDGGGTDVRDTVHRRSTLRPVARRACNRPQRFLSGASGRAPSAAGSSNSTGGAPGRKRHIGHESPHWNPVGRARAVGRYPSQPSHPSFRHRPPSPLFPVQVHDIISLQTSRIFLFHLDLSQ